MVRSNYMFIRLFDRLCGRMVTDRATGTEARVVVAGTALDLYETVFP